MNTVGNKIVHWQPKGAISASERVRRFTFARDLITRFLCSPPNNTLK
jgi:hypothetical protein